MVQDLEGIAMAADGTFWLCSEGGGNAGDPEDPVTSLNMLFHVTSSGEIVELVLLPDDLNAVQVSNGFEGVAVAGSYIVAALQREWTNETDPRICVYNTEEMTWQFAFYPLDAPESQYGGWGKSYHAETVIRFAFLTTRSLRLPVLGRLAILCIVLQSLTSFVCMLLAVGISDIEYLGESQFLVLERDNQAGPDAAIKRVYYVDMGDLSSVDGTILTKTLVTDLMPDLAAPGGLVIEKVEGLTVDGNGDMWINTDNDGVDDNSGENQFLKIGAAILPSQ
jgi:hypothetical protein